MDRLLRERGETRERGRQATHPVAVKPGLVARAPNRVWSWVGVREGLTGKQLTVRLAMGLSFGISTPPPLAQ